MNISKLIEKLRKLREQFENVEELREKIDSLIRELERVKNECKPVSLASAQLLAELLELLGEGMPEVIGDFAKAYLEAFKDAVQWISDIIWEQYKRLRATGWSHEDIKSAGVVTGKAEVLEWFRIRYELETAKGKNPPKPEEEPNPSTGEFLPLPGGGKVVVPWDSEYDNCCLNLPAAALSPNIAWGQPTFWAEGSDYYVSLKVQVTHKCSLKRSGITVFVITNKGEVMKHKKPWNWPKGVPMAGSVGMSYNIKKLQLSMDTPRGIRVLVRAVSNCGGAVDEEKTFTSP